MGRGWQISSPVSDCQVPGRNFPVPGIDGGAVQVPPGEKRGQHSARGRAGTLGVPVSGGAWSSAAGVRKFLARCHPQLEKALIPFCCLRALRSQQGLFYICKQHWERWGAWCKTLRAAEAICSDPLHTYLSSLLSTGKTERGSYSSYGRDSNLQGCHQVSGRLLSSEVAINTGRNEARG